MLSTEPRLGLSERLSVAYFLFPVLAVTRLNTVVEIGCLVTLLATSFIGVRRTSIRVGDFLPLVVFGGVGGLPILLRGGSQLEVASLSVLMLAAANAYLRSPSTVLLKSALAGISTYCVLNVVGWLAGLQSPAASVRTGELKTDFLFLDERVFFPFARSINEPAGVAGALIVFVLVRWRFTRSVSWWLGAGALCGLFILLASGSRFSVVTLVFVATLAIVTRRTARYLPYMALAVCWVPFFASYLQQVGLKLAPVVANLSYLARGQSVAELASGSTRLDFWVSGLNFWQQLPSLGVNQVFGFGYYGHVSSGVVFTYFDRDGFVTTPSALTLHSSFLQQLFDGGYLGVAALAIGLVMFARRAVRFREPSISALAASLLATGAFEVYLQSAFRAAPALLIFPLALAICDKGSSSDGTLL